MKLPLLSGREIVKILVKKFGFKVVKQKGSHIKLRKENSEKRTAETPEDVGGPRSPESPPMKMGGGKVSCSEIYKLCANYG